MTKIEQMELVNNWMKLADKMKTDRGWSETEEGKAEKDELFERTCNLIGL